MMKPEIIIVHDKDNEVSKVYSNILMDVRVMEHVPDPDNWGESDLFLGEHYVFSPDVLIEDDFTTLKNDIDRWEKGLKIRDVIKTLKKEMVGISITIQDSINKLIEHITEE